MQLQRTSTQDAAVYTDLNRLNRLKTGEQRNSEENIRQVAQEFESLFIAQMLKAMRSANDVMAEGNMFNSNESKTYRDMHDQQLSVTLAQGRGIGLADVLVRQMSEMGQARPKSNPFPDMQAAVASDKPAAAPQQQELPALRRNAALGSYAQIQQQVPVEHKHSFASPQEFIDTMLPLAQKAASRIGVAPHYLVAQAALETGWGKHLLRDGDGNSMNNLFGIKAHDWQGPSATATTSEYVNGEKRAEQAQFRQYRSFAQSFDDYVDFLTSNPRYQEALKVADNPEQYVRELQRAGYATDPGYADKIRRIAGPMHGLQQTQASAGTAATRG